LFKSSAFSLINIKELKHFELGYGDRFICQGLKIAKKVTLVELTKISRG